MRRYLDRILWAAAGFLVASVLGHAALPCTDIRGQWKLANGSYLDETANNNDFTAVNGPTSATGQFGGANLATDFESTSSQYLSLAYASSSGLNLTGPMAIAAHFKPESTGVYHILFGHLGTAAPNYTYDLFINDANKAVFRVSSNGTALTSVVGGQSLVAGTPYHIVGVYTGTTLKVYVNGDEDGGTTYSSGIHSASVPYYMGTNSVFSLFADGVLDDVLVCGHALTFSQVRTLHATKDDFVEWSIPPPGSGSNVLPMPFSAISAGNNPTRHGGNPLIQNTCTQAYFTAFGNCVGQYIPASAGTGTVTSGVGAITPPLPTGLQTDDLLFLAVETANEAVTIADHNGGSWTEVPDSPQGIGTAGATGATRLTVFCDRYNGTQGAPTTNDPGDHIVGAIVAIRGGSTSGDCGIDVTSGGTDGTGPTSLLIPGDTPTVNNDRVLILSSDDLDAVGSRCTSTTNSEIAGIVGHINDGTADGNGGGLCVASGRRSYKKAYGTTTMGQAAGITVNGYMTIAVRSTNTTSNYLGRQANFPVMVDDPLNANQVLIFVHGWEDFIASVNGVLGVGVCSAPKSDPLNWTCDADNPFIVQRNFLTDTLQFGSVFYDAALSKWRMYVDNDTGGKIYQITMTDAQFASRTYEFYGGGSGTPMLTGSVGGCTASNCETVVSNMGVSKYNDTTYLGFYAWRGTRDGVAATLPSIRLAISPDGNTWRKTGHEPCAVGTAGSYDDVYIEAANFDELQDEFVLLYVAYDGANWTISYCHSDSLLSSGWSKTGPFFSGVGSGGVWDEDHVATPSMHVIYPNVYLLYQGSRDGVPDPFVDYGKNFWSIGAATFPALPDYARLWWWLEHTR